MAFDNAPVNPTELPRLAEAPLVPVADSYPRYRALRSALRWAPLVALAAVVPPAYGLPVAAAAALLTLAGAAAVAATALAWLEARRRAWGLRERDLLYRRGLLVRRLTVLPLARVQHMETASGPLERGLGLARLSCFTAGGASADLVLEGLQRESADAVRQYVLARIPEREDGTGG
ncbi:PH domain-containing protein [Ectothiorhodospiraceae bacterium 2226]|nr:PH domain-containing protein [Ectothiorhodospiraceae bacterium 2226]